MSKLIKMDAACAVYALWYVAGICEDVVLRACKSCGFKEGEGMYDSEWRQVAKQLGIKTREVTIKPKTLRRFVKEHPKGLYFMSTRGHLFVLDDGLIVDPRYDKYPGLSRKVLQVWRATAPSD